MSFSVLEMKAKKVSNLRVTNFHAHVVLCHKSLVKKAMLNAHFLL